MRPRPWGWNSSGRRRWAILLLLLGHAFWIFMGRGDSGHWQRMLGVFSAPSRAVSTRWMAWRRNRAEKVENLDRAAEDLKRLRGRVASLETAALRNAGKIREADEAIRLLGLKKLLPLEFKAARIVANVRKAPFGGMIIDQGEDLGLVQDQGVICTDGVVGRIWSVGRHHASVLPLDAHNASTAVMLERSRATGVLQGVEPGQAEIRYVGSQELVQVNEAVYTSGLDNVFPRGLLVGYVSAVHAEDVELRIEVALAAPLDRLNLVLILPPSPGMELQVPGTPESKPGTGAPK